MASSGALVEETSIPWHLDGYDVATALVIEGSARFLFDQNAVGFSLNGHHPEALTHFWTEAWKKAPDKLPDIGKFVLLFGAFLNQTYRGRFYGKAQNLRRKLRAAYDDALRKY